MSDNNNVGGMAAVDFASLSKADLVSMLERKAQEDAHRERLAGVSIDYVVGVSKAGKPFEVLQVKGGDLGWRGFNLKPDTWKRLKALTPDIDAAMANYFPQG